MHHCQPLVLIFQIFKILEQRTLAPLSLNLGSIPVWGNFQNSSKVPTYNSTTCSRISTSRWFGGEAHQQQHLLQTHQQQQHVAKTQIEQQLYMCYENLFHMPAIQATQGQTQEQLPEFQTQIEQQLKESNERLLNPIPEIALQIHQ